MISCDCCLTFLPVSWIQHDSMKARCVNWEAYIIRNIRVQNRTELSSSLFLKHNRYQ